MPNYFRTIVFAVLVGLALPSHALAQPGPSTPGLSSARCLNAFEPSVDTEIRTEICEKLGLARSWDKAVYDSPALAALDATPKKSIQPVTPDQLALGLVNGFDPNGNFQQGVAIDTNPIMMLMGDSISLNSYRDDFYTRFLARSSASIATIKGQSNDDESSKLAIGLSFTPWDEGDLKLDRNYDACLRSVLANGLTSRPVEFDSPYDAKVGPDGHLQWAPGKQQEYLDAVKKWKQDTAVRVSQNVNSDEAKDCRGKFSSRASTASAWKFGIAPTWLSESSDLDDLEYTGTSIWTSLAINLGLGITESPLGRMIFHGRYRSGEMVPVSNGNNQFFEQDTLTLAGQLELNLLDYRSKLAGGTFSDPKLSIEGAYYDASKENRPDDTYYQLTANTQIRIPGLGENLWLDVSLGRTFGRTGDENAFIGTSLKWAFNDKSPK